MNKSAVISLFSLIAISLSLNLPGNTSTSSYYLDNSRLELQVSPATGTASGVVKVSSNSDRSIRLKVIPKLWELTPLGVLTYTEPPADGYNLLDNININPQEFELMPGKSKLVRFLVKVPSDLENAEFPFQLYFEPVSLLTPITGPQGTNVSSILNVVPVFTTTIYVYKGNPKPNVSVNDFTCGYLPDSKQFKIAFNLENQGSKHARLFGNILISPKQVSLQQSSPLEVLHLQNSGLLIVFPQKQRRVDTILEPKNIQRLDAGQYDMELRLVDERNEQDALQAICSFSVDHQ